MSPPLECKLHENKDLFCSFHPKYIEQSLQHSKNSEDIYLINERIMFKGQCRIKSSFIHIKYATKGLFLLVDSHAGTVSS